MSFDKVKVVPLKNELPYEVVDSPRERPRHEQDGVCLQIFLSFPDPNVHRDCLVEVAAADLHVAARICGSYCKLVHLARTTPSHPR